MATTPPLTDDQFAGEVRAYLRDFPELNRLITGEESSNRMIKYCLWLALDEWNTTPPLSSHSTANFPSRLILLQLVLVHLLTSVGILKSRNRLAYNDGGYSAETEAQDDRYVRWIQLIRSQLDPRIMRLKLALNIAGGWGAGASSEYGYLHGWYGLT